MNGLKPRAGFALGRAPFATVGGRRPRSLKTESYAVTWRVRRSEEDVRRGAMTLVAALLLRREDERAP